MANTVREIADWLESFLHGDDDDPEEVVAVFKTQFPDMPITALDEAVAVCEARMLERSRPEGTAWASLTPTTKGQRLRQPAAFAWRRYRVKAMNAAGQSGAFRDTPLTPVTRQLHNS